MFQKDAEAAFAERPVKWYYGITTVLLALFVFLGPLALPLLWKSPRFTRFWKIALTLAVVLFTVIMVWTTWESTNAMLKIYAGEVQKLQV